MQKYLLKEDAEYPVKQNSNLLTAHSEDKYFADIQWALKTHMPINSIKEIKTKILSSSRVLKAIEFEVEQRMGKDHISIDKARTVVRVEAEKVIN